MAGPFAHAYRKLTRFLLSEHGRDLAFGGAVNAGVGPALFPAVQIGLRFFETFETLTFQRRLLGVANAPLDLTLGEKRALQTVTRVDYKFLLSRIRSIH